MDLDTWWALIDEARAAAGARADDGESPDDPLPGALAGALGRLALEEIADFAVTHIQIHDSAYLWRLWGAAYLIEGGCSNDGFMDFRDGLILLGRDAFDRALAEPDSLAGLPVVTRMSEGKDWLGYESLSYRIKDAYRRAAGETGSLEARIEDALKDTGRPEEPMGEDWDFDDDQEARRRLPRLAALFLD